MADSTQNAAAAGFPGGAGEGNRTPIASLGMGVVIAANRLLPGWWRWLPLGLIAAQFPIFAIADIAGVVSGSDMVADGVGLTLTGIAWMVFGYGLTLAQPVTPHDLSPRRA